ncbi:hypothetical protein BDZ91DRAFT_362831 [Kalaharituber pfeilii]|nr:hypothetical protein BDZ91DRAFT_362831 [Kalaharituber pfeilii]
MFPYSWFRLLFRLLFLWPFLLFQLLFPWPTTLLILWPFRLLILWPIRLLILWPIRLLILWPFRLLFREHDAGLAVITPEIRVISVKPTSTPLQYSDQYTHEEAQMALQSYRRY